MFNDYMNRTDNLTLPNTKEDWEAFHWKLHFLGGASIRLVYHLIAKEKEARRDAEKSNNSNQDDVPQGLLD
jgi:hypothetical protein